MNKPYTLVMRVSDPKDKGDFFRNHSITFAHDYEALEALKNYMYYAWIGRSTGIPRFDIGVYHTDDNGNTTCINYSNCGYEEDKDYEEI